MSEDNQNTFDFDCLFNADEALGMDISSYENLTPEQAVNWCRNYCKKVERLVLFKQTGRFDFSLIKAMPWKPDETPLESYYAI